MKIRYKLSERIADYQFKTNKRLTLLDLAAATGVHRMTLSKMLNHHDANVTVQTVCHLAEFFKCGLGDLVELSDE